MRVSNADKCETARSFAVMRQHHDDTVCEAIHSACAAGWSVAMAVAVPLVPIETDDEHNEIQVVPDSRWHTKHGSKSNEAPDITQTQISPDLRRPARSPLRAD